MVAENLLELPTTVSVLVESGKERSHTTTLCQSCIRGLTTAKQPNGLHCKVWVVQTVAKCLQSSMLTWRVRCDVTLGEWRRKNTTVTPSRQSDFSHTAVAIAAALPLILSWLQ